MSSTAPHRNSLFIDTIAYPVMRRWTYVVLALGLTAFTDLPLGRLTTACGQEWIPRHSQPMNLASQASPPHLVIEAPQAAPHSLHRHHHAGSEHEASQPAVTITHPESVGGGHWNEPLQRASAATDSHPSAAGHLPLKKSIHDLAHHLPSHAHKTPAPIAIPAAPRVTGWKQPYSYGHFGAKHNRQLSVHHGHQRSYTQLNIR
jgi:hypothetical protein